MEETKLMGHRGLEQMPSCMSSRTPSQLLGKEELDGAEDRVAKETLLVIPGGRPRKGWVDDVEGG